VPPGAVPHCHPPAPGELQAHVAQHAAHDAETPSPDRRPPGRHRDGSKTARFLDAVVARYGPLAGLDLDKTARIAGEVAEEAELHEGSARAALRNAVLAAKAADPSDGAL